MNTEEITDLYKKINQSAAPEFWDRIDAKLTPHAQLTEKEQNALADYNAPSAVPETIQDTRPADIEKYRRKKQRTGVKIAAAAVIAGIPALLFFAGSRGKQYSAVAYGIEAADTAAAPKAAATEALPKAPATEAVPKAAATEAAAARASDTSVAVKTADTADISGASEAPGTVGAAGTILLTVPEDAIVSPADEAYFTEELLADTDQLAVVQVESALLECDKDGHAYRLNYDAEVKDSLLEDGESGKTGSRIRIVSPIVSSGSPGEPVLYQLIPGQSYIVPLKKAGGDWELISPFSPQIQLHEDGSFEFHTGYHDLINEDTEAAPDRQAADDDFWFDRKVSRSDPAFLHELTELVKIEKKNKKSP